MRILILGAAGFIGTNLTRKLIDAGDAELVLYNRPGAVYHIGEGAKVEKIEGNFSETEDFDGLTRGTDIVYHLISTTIPGNSNDHIARGIRENVVVTAKLLDACVRNKVKKIIFISSGGAVYGIRREMPITEDTAIEPISAYGMQKISIEKLLYLYRYMYNLDYRIVRLANPYGPYQKPNGVQGVLTTFIYKAIKGEPLKLYGDGNIIRDYIYIDDAIEGILAISRYEGANKIFNLGTGEGHRINELIELIRRELDVEPQIEQLPGRKVDVPINILSMAMYDQCIGKLTYTTIEEGIKRTADFFHKEITS